MFLTEGSQGLAHRPGGTEHGSGQHSAPIEPHAPSSVCARVALIAEARSIEGRKHALEPEDEKVQLR